MSVQKAVCEYLDSHGIKQSFLVEKCGWSKQKVSSIIRGKQTMSADEMMAICKAVGVPYDFFYKAAEAARDKD